GPGPSSSFAARRRDGGLGCWHSCLRARTQRGVRFGRLRLSAHGRNHLAVPAAGILHAVGGDLLSAPGRLALLGRVSPVRLPRLALPRGCVRVSHRQPDSPAPPLRPPVRRRTWIGVVRRLLPLIVVTIAYVGLRVGVAGGRSHNQPVPCRGVRCLAAGAIDYLNRLVLRPNRLISLDTSDRTTIALLTVLAGVLLAVVLRPWAWSTWPAVLFALSWIALSSLLFIVTLWPYSSDRFLYLPD